uniref:Uncharacterized protein n=1 Tax=Anguilla anguilla TaxID=7936 RepID=A0A0E9UEX0_ANGAN
MQLQMHMIPCLNCPNSFYMLILSCIDAMSMRMMFRFQAQMHCESTWKNSCLSVY